MVSCPNNPSRMMSPGPTLGASLRGVTKRPAKQLFATTKPKKAQRALCTIFEESALTASSPLFGIKAAWLKQSPSGRASRRNNIPMHPALERLRVQEMRETPTARKATPIKDRQTALRAAYGRHRIQNELDALTDELGTCQLQTALKPAGPHMHVHSQAPGVSDLQPLAPMQDD
ncbi:hypothetical protein Vretifemale_9782 [Volvox reticuliferus]|uniref:Uncharacterized protein n=1 Tax=Volvox reticuliferus TaxID=1737510 RepID=A0A8J4CKY1_9CHLO|nr:hypothetical protein Vretifemale_9782 [Volvox reticuliferus]